jgi:sulfur-oxidizing protein SoxX
MMQEPVPRKGVSRARTRDRRKVAVFAAAVAVVVLPGVGDCATPAGVYEVIGDSIPASLTGRRGDAARGRGVVMDRHVGLCLLCHGGPFPEERFQGTIAPDLKGTGARLSEAQIRLRIVDSRRVNAGTIMPAYYRTEGLTRVAPAYQGKTVLTAEQIEDVVAYLATLRD